MQTRARKILILDDDIVLLDTAARLLERAGFDVVICSAKFNRLNFIKDQQPDLVLMDVNMPFLPGDEVIKLMQQEPRLRLVPVVLFSSNEEGELRRMVSETGARGFISKSDIGVQFAAKVGRILQRIEADAPA